MPDNTERRRRHFISFPGRFGCVCAGDDIVIGKTSPIPDDGSGLPQRYSKKVRATVGMTAAL